MPTDPTQKLPSSLGNERHKAPVMDPLRGGYVFVSQTEAQSIEACTQERNGRGGEEHGGHVMAAGILTKTVDSYPSNWPGKPTCMIVETGHGHSDRNIG